MVVLDTVEINALEASIAVAFVLIHFCVHAVSNTLPAYIEEEDVVSGKLKERQTEQQYIKDNAWARLKAADVRFWQNRQMFFRGGLFMLIAICVIFFSMMVFWSVVIDRIQGSDTTIIMNPPIFGSHVYNWRMGFHLGMQGSCAFLFMMGSMAMFWALAPMTGLIMMLIGLAAGLVSDIYGLAVMQFPSSTIYVALSATSLAIDGLSFIVLILGYYWWFTKEGGSKVSQFKPRNRSYN
jgi:hypothetical protein